MKTFKKFGWKFNNPTNPSFYKLLAEADKFKKTCKETMKTLLLARRALKTFPNGSDYNVNELKMTIEELSKKEKCGACNGTGIEFYQWDENDYSKDICSVCDGEKYFYPLEKLTL